MKKIVVRKPDGGIIIVHPNEDKYGDEDGKRPLSECKGLARYIDHDHPDFDSSVGVLEWDIVDAETIPQKSGLESRRQLMWEDDGSGGVRYIRDESWDKRLMHPDLIKRKHVGRLNAKIDKELEKADPDVKSLHKMSREKELCPDWPEKKCYEKAIENLDERVANGESDKPLIRQKLNDKIAELESKEGS